MWEVLYNNNHDDNDNDNNSNNNDDDDDDNKYLHMISLNTVLKGIFGPQEDPCLRITKKRNFPCR